MSPKGSFWSDTFEQLAELGKTTVKQSAQSVKQTLDPLKMLDSAVHPGKTADKGIEQLEQGKGKKSNHTPLDLAKLQGNYDQQDKAKADVLRNRLFQLVKTGEEKAIMAKKQEEQEKKRKEAYETEEKKRRQKELQLQQSQAETPHGKERRSIFSPKKVARREQTEVKPSSGKQ